MAAAAASVSFDVEAGVEKAGSRIGWLERYVGDLDSAFALTVPKQVAIRDRRLGLVNYSLLATVATGALVAFLAAGEHLEEQRMNFRTIVHPSAKSGWERQEDYPGGRPRVFSDDEVGFATIDKNEPTITIEPKLFGSSQEYRRSANCTHIAPETMEECKWVHDESERVRFEVPEADSFSISISSIISPRGDLSTLPVSLNPFTVNAIGFVRRASGERYPAPSITGSSEPAGVAVADHWLSMQVRDMLELAGYEYLTCMISREAVPGDGNEHVHAVKTCAPAEPWRQTRPPPPTNFSWRLRPLRWVQDHMDDTAFIRFNDTAFFNETLLRDPLSGSLDVFRPGVLHRDGFTLHVDWTNACPWSVWQSEAWTRCGIFSTALGRGPLSFVVSASMETNPLGYLMPPTVDFAYGQPPLKKTVNQVAKGHWTVQVTSSVRVLCSFSKLLSFLAGYSFLFTACSYVLKFVVVRYAKHRAAYKALITQRSADFSQMDDLTTTCKEFIAKRGETFDPKRHKTTPHGLCLARALERLPEKPGAEDVLLALLAHEQRLNTLDAMDEPNTNEAEKDVFRTYLEEKEQELTQRNRAGETWEPAQQGQAGDGGSSRPLLKGCW